MKTHHIDGNRSPSFLSRDLESEYKEGEKVAQEDKNEGESEVYTLVIKMDLKKTWYENAEWGYLA
jgi:hypothetical protein